MIDLELSVFFISIAIFGWYLFKTIDHLLFNDAPDLISTLSWLFAWIVIVSIIFYYLDLSLFDNVWF